MKKALKNMSAALALLALPLVSQAGSNVYQSADFDFEGRDLLSSLKQADIGVSSSVLYCRADEHSQRH